MSIRSLRRSTAAVLLAASAAVPLSGVATAAPAAAPSAAPVPASGSAVGAFAPTIWGDVKEAVGVWAGVAGWMAGGGSFDTVPWDDIRTDARFHAGTE